MTQLLRQSTAGQGITLGPFMDVNGAVQPGLTINATDIKISKDGAAAVNKNSGGATHDVNGEYLATLNAADSNTVGRMTITVLVAPALVVKATFIVLEEAVYDALYASGAAGYAQATDIVTGGAITTAGGEVSTVGTVNTLASNAISSASLSPAAANKQADHVLRRSYATTRASGDGDTVQFRSLFGAVAKLVNRVDAASSPMDIYHEDDLTIFGQQDLTTDPMADPITGVNTQ